MVIKKIKVEQSKRERKEGNRETARKSHHRGSQ